LNVFIQFNIIAFLLVIYGYEETSVRTLKEINIELKVQMFSADVDNDENN